MSKILRNDTLTAVVLNDVGIVTINPGVSFTIDPLDYLRFARSDDVVTAVGNSDLIVNDGSTDLSINDGIKLIQGIFPNPVNAILADPVDAVITGFDANVAVEASGLKPGLQFLYKDRRLGQGGDPDVWEMDIDGDPTSVDFYYEVPAGETNFWEYISVFIADSGSSDFRDFGAIGGGLSNGMQLILRLSGVEYEIGNFKDNAGLSMCFSEHAVPSGPRGEDGRGWFDEDDYFMGTKMWPRPMKMEAGDRIIMRVRDDVRGLTTMGAVVRLFRVLP